jgi:hypothetical protein
LEARASCGTPPIIAEESINNKLGAAIPTFMPSLPPYPLFYFNEKNKKEIS